MRRTQALSGSIWIDTCMEEFIFRNSCNVQLLRILPGYCFVCQRIELFLLLMHQCFQCKSCAVPESAVLTSVHAKIAFRPNCFNEAVRPANKTEGHEPQDLKGGWVQRKTKQISWSGFHLHSVSKTLSWDGNCISLWMCHCWGLSPVSTPNSQGLWNPWLTLHTLSAF